MTSTLTISSGAATPKIECSTCATQGFSGVSRIELKGARATPKSEMLAAPSRNAIQTLAGDPGRSPAAITSHNISSAGATAAAPTTLGRDARRFIDVVNTLFSDGCGVCPHARFTHKRQESAKPPQE